MYYAYTQLARPGEVLSVLVEANSHDAVGGVERLLDAVTVVHVNVDVQHTCMITKQLQDAKHDIWIMAEGKEVPNHA